MAKRFNQQTQEVLDRIMAEERKRYKATLDTALKELRKPDREKYADILPSGPADKAYYGSAGRTRPAWEQAYERNAHHWDDEERKLRTPENDMEVVRFFDAVIKGDHAMLRQIEDRQSRPSHVRADMSTTVGGVGMVPQSFYNLVQLLTNRVNKLRSLVTVIPMGGEQGSSMKVPTVTTNPVPVVYAEGVDMSSGEPVIGSVTLSPKKLGQVIMLSRELWEDTPLPTATLLAQLVTEAIGSMEDYNICHPTPTDFTGNLVDDTTASADTFDDDAETLATLASKLYELPLDAVNNATWLINTAAAEALSALTATNARQIFLPFNDAPSYLGGAEGGSGMLLGRPVRVLPVATIPADTAIVGDLTAYTLLDREYIHVEVDRNALFKNDQVGVHVSRRVDGTVAQATRIRNHPAA